MSKSETLALIAGATGTAINILLAKQQAEATLVQAQEEGWSDNDTRWQGPFDVADAALKAALERL